jgi:hypothetical protein
VIGVIYLLCAATSIVCAALLWRGWRQTRARLLLWSTICFAGIALNNVLLVVDTRVLPDIDLAIVRLVPALIGVAALLYGLILDDE